MEKDLPQPSPERLAELISKHLIPALQKQVSREQKYEHLPKSIDLTEQAKKAKQEEKP